MKNKIEDLRNHLFEEIERLKEKAEPEDLERAKTVSNLSGRIIESAKVEVDFLRTVGDLSDAKTSGSGFIPNAPRRPAIPHKSDGTH